MDRMTQWMDLLFIERRWLVHVVFWVGILSFYVLFFGRSNSNYLQTLLFVSLVMPVTIGCTYIINYYMLPQFLMRGRYAIFLLYTFYILLVALFLEMMVALLTFIVVAGFNIRAMSATSFDVLFLLTSLLLVIVLGVAIKMVLHWRQSKEDYHKLMREKVESELKFLRVQLNPHFLFNTLNNLYYLTTTKSDLAPRAILQLSEILDYVLRAGKKIFVSVEEELRQVENYFSLELLRYEDRVKVSKHVDGRLQGVSIGPMILVILIENAFKHGVAPVSESAWIDFKVSVGRSWIDVEVGNSCRVTSRTEGIGLQNLKNQLDLIYKDNYEYLVDRSSNTYRVKLKLPIGER